MRLHYKNYAGREFQAYFLVQGKKELILAYLEDDGKLAMRK
jgi:hypothetical protein